MKWTQPDEDGLVAFMCGDKNFNEERIRNGAKKLVKAKSGSTQGRLDSFFKVLPSSPKPTPTTPGGTKRKVRGGFGFVGFLVSLDFWFRFL